MTEQILRYQMAVRADPKRFKPEGRASARALKSIFYSSCRDRLAEVSKPVLLIFGAHDFIHPPKDGEFFHRHLPDSRLMIVADAAHEVMVDRPDLFNQAVMSFFGHTSSVAEAHRGGEPSGQDSESGETGQTSTK